MTLDEQIRGIVRDEVARAVSQLQVNAPSADELLTAAEVAKLLGCSRRALDERFRRHRRDGEAHPLEGMAKQIEGARRWRRGDVLAYVQAAGR